jgi:hypothetical protein
MVADYAFCDTRLLAPLADVIGQRILRGTWTVGVPFASIGLSPTGGDIVIPSNLCTQAPVAYQRATALAQVVDSERQDMLFIHKTDSYPDTGSLVSGNSCELGDFAVGWLAFMSGLDADKCGLREREGLIKCAYLMVARATSKYCFCLPNQVACAYTRGVWGHSSPLTAWHGSQIGYLITRAAKRGAVRGAHINLLSLPFTTSDLVANYALRASGNPMFTLLFFTADLAASAIPTVAKVSAFKALLFACSNAVNMIAALNLESGLPLDWTWDSRYKSDTWPEDDYPDKWVAFLESLVMYSNVQALVYATKEAIATAALTPGALDSVAHRIIARGELGLLQAFHEAANAYRYHDMKWHPFRSGVCSMTNKTFWCVLSREQDYHDRRSINVSTTTDSCGTSVGSACGLRSQSNLKSLAVRICKCLEWYRAIGVITAQDLSTAANVMSELPEVSKLYDFKPDLTNESP